MLNIKEPEFLLVSRKNFTKNEPRLTIEYDVPTEEGHEFFDFVVNLAVGEYVGRCCLKKIDIGLLETHSELDVELRGAGYGIMMYSAAIRFAKELGFRVCSSPHVEMFEAAHRLWQSRELNKSFRIYRDVDRYRVL